MMGVPSVPPVGVPRVVVGGGSPARVPGVRFVVGDRVVTEYGCGVVRESSARRVFIVLDDGEWLNVSSGTPGFGRIRLVCA